MAANHHYWLLSPINPYIPIPKKLAKPNKPPSFLFSEVPRCHCGPNRRSSYPRTFSSTPGSGERWTKQLMVIPSWLMVNNRQPFWIFQLYMAMGQAVNHQEWGIILNQFIGNTSWLMMGHHHKKTWPRTMSEPPKSTNMTSQWVHLSKEPLS